MKKHWLLSGAIFILSGFSVLATDTLPVLAPQATGCAVRIQTGKFLDLPGLDEALTISGALLSDSLPEEFSPQMIRDNYASWVDEILVCLPEGIMSGDTDDTVVLLRTSKELSGDEVLKNLPEGSKKVSGAGIATETLELNPDVISARRSAPVHIAKVAPEVWAVGEKSALKKYLQLDQDKRQLPAGLLSLVPGKSAVECGMDQDSAGKRKLPVRTLGGRLDGNGDNLVLTLFSQAATAKEAKGIQQQFQMLSALFCGIVFSQDQYLFNRMFKELKPTVKGDTVEMTVEADSELRARLAAYIARQAQIQIELREQRRLERQKAREAKAAQENK